MIVEFNWSELVLVFALCIGCFQLGKNMKDESI
jgi:hypothetical protein